MIKNFILSTVILIILSACLSPASKNLTPEEPQDKFSEMILIPAGEFLMGTSEKDQSIIGFLDETEMPQHKEFVEAFYIGKYEVTNSQFKRFIDDNGYNKKRYWTKEGWEYRKRLNFDKPSYWEKGDYHSGLDYPEHPAVGISWYEVTAYAKWAGMRLPTEKEWEKAARGTDGRIWPWGNEFDKTKANTNEAGIGGSTPVGTFPTGASPYGAMDMAGNVAEWMADLYTPYATDTEKAPKPLDGERRNLRGSSWGYSSYWVRTAFRGLQFPHDRWRGKHMGMRLAKDKR